MLAEEKWQQRAVARSKRLYRFRRVLYNRGYQNIAGIDEAGRGPLAGPVVAAAVILPPGIAPFGLDDSKQLTELRREKLFCEIQEEAVAIGIGMAESQEIDSMNIHKASLVAMYRAVAALSRLPDFCLVDGKFAIPGISSPQRAIVAGDRRSDAVAAASIIAKVTRDRLLVELDSTYPLYGFAKHKGYPTRQHLQALEEYGPCPIHRYSYAPVRLAGLDATLARGDSHKDRTG